MIRIIPLPYFDNKQGCDSGKTLTRIMQESIYYAAPFPAVLALRRSTYSEMRLRAAHSRERPGVTTICAAQYEKLMHNPG